MVPVASLGGGDVLRSLYAVRVAGAILAAVAGATAAILAGRWFPDQSRLTPLGAGLFVSATPAVAAVGARVSNDALLVPLMAIGILAATALLDQPSWRRGAVLGAVTAAAVLTKSSGLVLLLAAALAVGTLWVRGSRSWLTGMAALGPGMCAALLWAAWTYRTYGVLEGSGAFLAVVRPFSPLAGPAFLEALWLDTWDSYWHEYGVHSILLRALPGMWWGIVLAGLFTGARRSDARVPALLTATLLSGLIAVLWLGNMEGLFHPRGRFIAPAYPAVAALVAGGWSRAIRGWGAMVPAAAAWGSSIAYAAFWLVPFFSR